MVALDFSNHFGTTMCGYFLFDLIQFDGHIFSIGLKILAKTPPKMQVYIRSIRMTCFSRLMPT